MIKNKTSPSLLLFDKEGTDSFYMNIRSECDPWHAEAKAYWQQLYHQHSQYLDDNFSDELRNDCISRLWELTLINFIAEQEPKGLNRIDHRSKKKVTIHHNSHCRQIVVMKCQAGHKLN